VANKENLEKKMDQAQEVVAEAFAKYPLEDLAIAWTGGKDSTLVLHIVYEVCQKKNLKVPKCFCIDEGDMFEEVKDFIEKTKKRYDVELDFVHNDDVSKAAKGELGAMVKVSDLSERNRREIGRLGFEGEEFPYDPESFVGNHLMKTVPLNSYLEERGLEGFFEGIRWDEQDARADETYFSPREASEYNPEHVRISPILHFLEEDVWKATFEYDIPYCSLYEEGYRSLGAKETTGKADDVPAWEQDLEKTNERGGRRQDKEKVMEKLRKLGYM